MELVKNLSGLFFLVCLVIVLYFCYLIFKPFLAVILVSGAIVVSSYPHYLTVLAKFKNNATVASAVMCFIIVMAVVIPVFFFLFYLSKSSVEAYSSLIHVFNGDFAQKINSFLNANLHLDAQLNLKENFVDIMGRLNSLLVSGIGIFIKGTSEVITSMLLMVITMFFLFRDGKLLLMRVMRLTPLKDKYDREIFHKFREVSYSALVSTLVTGIAQGLVAGIGFAIVGVPFLFLAIATAFASLIPFVGSALVWIPTVVFLLVQGKIIAGLFLFAWGLLVISLIDNLLRPLLMKGHTRIHPLILFFSIFGGIVVFGFWGIIFGPLIIAIALTLLHIYEVEYKSLL